MIEIFVNNFIKPQYRERLLYELKSIKTNKREKAFIKLLDYNEYFLKTLSKIDPSHKTNQEIIRILKTDVKLENGYSLKWQTNKDLIKTVINAINSYSLDIVLINQNTMIYIGEVYHNNDGSNASVKFFL